jgi:hypothetical protein
MLILQTCLGCKHWKSEPEFDINGMATGAIVWCEFDKIEGHETCNLHGSILDPIGSLWGSKEDKTDLS